MKKLYGSSITKESYFLKVLWNKKGIKCIPEYYGDGFHGNNQYIKIEYVDSTLEKYLEATDIAGKLSFEEISIQLLECLKQLHMVGFIHQDVKPDNFLISSIDNKVRVIDLGIMMEYRSNGAPWRHGFQGTPVFGSIKALEGYSLSRRDDLECLGYTIMYLLDPSKIPWS